MNKKKFLLLNLFLALIIFAIACSNNNKGPIKLDAQQSIKEIIISKGKDYDFLEDTVYLDNMESFVESLKSKNSNSQINSAIGNLDEDNIPELAIFTGKDLEDEEDEGRLEIYSFDGEKYTVLDTASMNFDVSNYQMEIGNISEEEKGIFLNNNVGKSSGITYGFKLKDHKLQNILNSNKINLVSIFTRNQIKDINNDGILNFSVYTVDPETEDVTAEGSDKMTIWYQWDGDDSAEVVEVERKDLSQAPSDMKTYSNLNESLNHELRGFIPMLSKNKEKLSDYDNTKLLSSYIDKLESQSYQKTSYLENLLMQYQDEKSQDHIFDKYGIAIDNLNSLEYLSREKVLKDETEIKEALIENINLGYKLNNQEGMYYYSLDYKEILNLFEENLTREYRDYIQILALNSEEPFLNDGSLTISDDALAERILILDSFKTFYPFSGFYEEVENIYKSYIYIYLYGDNHNPKYNIDTGKIDEDALEDFKSKLSEYPNTNFADILEKFIRLLEENNYIVDVNIRQNLKID